MTGKVERAHVQRAAYVYVRQSTMAQVEHNTESLARQYELVDRAAALGWAAGDVVVVDSDLGVSAKSTDGREGFARLVADVGLGKVGIVLGIEVSRLARRNADWYQLLDLCAVTNTLIADADGVYHPGLHNDRLLLGLKGTMSEAELHVLRTRMREGALHKVARGQLRISLPTGYDYDELGQMRITPDEAVADAIGTVFAYFDQLSSARQVMLRLVAEGRLLPRRRSTDRHVRWARASYGAVRDFLTNPCYAGVYAYGRKRLRRTVQDGVVRERMVLAPREEWHAFLADHHPGYITLERWEANQKRLRDNVLTPGGYGSPGAPREGRALLQGLVRCGRCSRKLEVSYSGHSLTPRYRYTKAQAMYGTAICQSIGGQRIEQLVLDAVFAALAPAAIDATLRAMQQLTDTYQAQVRSAELQLERARQTADRAQRQFDRCEPENRLVARTLESEWERALLDVSHAEQRLAAIRARRPQPLTEQEIAWCRHAGADLRAVFDAPSTTARDRKLLLRAMITDIVVTVEREHRRALLRIVWEGGAVTEWFASDFASEVGLFFMPILRGCWGYGSGGRDDGERQAAQAAAAVAGGEVGDLSGGHLAGALAVRRGQEVERRCEHGGQAQGAGEGRGVGCVRGVEARRPVALAGAGGARGGAGGERQALGSVEGDGGRVDLVPGKAALGLFGPVPARVSAQTKLELLGLIDGAVADGWPHAGACRVLELVDERAHRWRARLRETGTLEDRGPGGGAVHGLLGWEEQAILDLIETWGWVDRSHRKLAHRGSYTGTVFVSPSTVLRVALKNRVQLPGEPFRTRPLKPPFPEISWERNRIWIWDASHFTRCKRVAYAIVDVVTRYWIGYLLTTEQTHTQVQLLFARALEDQGLLGPDGLALRDDDDDSPILVAWSDNGAEMTAIDTRQFMALMAITQHHGRPGTPTDQAHIESFSVT